MLIKNGITVCSCVSRAFVEKRKIAIIVASLREAGCEVRVVPDLCREIVNKSPDLADIAAGTVIACFPRAVEAQFDWLGLHVNRALDVRNSSCEDILGGLNVACAVTADIIDATLAEIAAFPKEEGTDAWNPVIDKARCTDCGRCHDFCLFGVYAIDNKRIVVKNPEKCKNNCPSCARMCPNRAIIFPKYEKSPINGGIEEEETFNPEDMEKAYRERLRRKLQQRRESILLLKR